MTDEPREPEARKLAGRVSVDGQWYGPDDDLPPEVAEKITNPKAWQSEEDRAKATNEQQGQKPGAPTGARLASRVNVAGTWYGPDDAIPEDVAARITNPKAWEGGKLPGAEGADAAETDDPGTGETGADSAPKARKAPTKRA